MFRACGRSLAPFGGSELGPRTRATDSTRQRVTLARSEGPVVEEYCTADSLDSKSTSGRAPSYLHKIRIIGRTRRHSNPSAFLSVYCEDCFSNREWSPECEDRLSSVHSLRGCFSDRQARSLLERS
jgi:hypothetical protein